MGYSRLPSFILKDGLPVSGAPMEWSRSIESGRSAAPFDGYRHFHRRHTLNWMIGNATR
jgi:hypothetical protein